MELQRRTLKTSPTVDGMVKQFPPNEPVNASTLTNAILNRSRHRKQYASEIFSSFQLVETDEKRVVSEWITNVDALFDEQRLKENKQEPILHGKLAIIGLALLDRQLYQQMKQRGAYQALINDIKPPLSDLVSILSDYGQEVYAELQKSSLSDTVSNWPDDPLQKMESDLLGRAAFAQFLAKRIASVPKDSGAYALHIYGPWGAGKSTLLNFLETSLCNEKENTDQTWLIVDFNAWRNQHIDPPWWSLMEAIFQRTKNKLFWTERLQEYGWRLRTGGVPQIVAGLVLLWLFVLAIGWIIQQNIIAPAAVEGGIPNILVDLGSAAKSFGQILALIATIWSGIVAFNRSLLAGSAKVAQSYKDRIHDPMNEIKQRFNKLIERVAPCRVAVFIDDLDRCQSQYVVDLLEGIQTLFREAPVVYVVAADQRWINACYAQIYGKFESKIYEAGKPLGNLFLEKAFRFSTPMPGIPERLKNQYWQYLLQVRPEHRKSDWEAARRRAKKLTIQATGEESINSLVTDSSNRTFVEQQAIREEAVVQLAVPEVLERLEHTLKPYSEFLTSNPRSMKRLVNVYSANRALAILAGIHIERHQLVLWTILQARWPQLADYLEQNPVMVARIGQQNPPDVTAVLKPLFDSKEVVKVVKGSSLGNDLQVETIEMCTRMHA